ncbi:MAG: response regulator, partial [Bacteroidales bacterium]
PVRDKSGAIWVSCNNQLVRIDSTKSDFIVYEDEYRGRFVLNGDSTALYIISDRTLKRYDLVNKILTFTSIEDIPGPVEIRRLNTIFYDSENICWVGTSDGLYIFDEEQVRFIDPVEKYYLDLGTRKHMNSEEITAIYEDFRQDIWVASGSTLWRIDRNSREVEVLIHDLDNPNSILDAQITGIHGNRTGIIWLTYLNEGFTRIKVKRQPFRSYRYTGDDTGGLGGNTVRSLFKDREGIIWVGLYNNGLDRIDTKTKRITHYENDPGNPRSICSNYISSILLDDHGKLWVGSHDNGLCYADHVDDVNLTFQRPDFLHQNEEIYHIQQDNLGRIWFGTRNGLGLYDYRSGMFQWILENLNVQSFLFDDYSVWIASWTHGLCRLDFDPQSYSLMTPVMDTSTSFFSVSEETGKNRVLSAGMDQRGLRNCISIYQDDLSRVWVGTFDMGLAKVERNGNGLNYTRYDVSQGAPGNSVYGVSGDRQGKIWLSTEQGLGNFDPETEHFTNYYREDGLLSDFFMWKSYFKADNGELFFGSVDGFNLFFPEEIHADTTNPRVFISELRIQNKLVECGDTINGDIILDRHITYTDHLVLNHRNNTNFSFSFYAIGMGNHQRIRYSYMLEGFDPDWVEDRHGTRMATYAFLSPGNYTFKVRAAENELTWDGSYEMKQLTILPPWWKTKLAMVVYLILIVALVFAITHSLIRFLSLKHELIYNEKLHQSKLMFFTNISHEFKTPLSLIKAPLNEILNERELSPRNRRNLHVARHNADNLLKLVNELLEFRRTDTGNSKLRAEKIELTGFLKEMAEEFECLADQKKVNFYFDIPDKKIPLWADLEKFRKIINNLLENALNYTSEDGLVTFSIIRNPLTYSFKPNYHTLQLNNIKKQFEYIGILVSDTGVGISKDSLPKIFDRFYQIDAERASHHIGSGIGLALVKNLVLIHHGEIRIGSERTVGTDILVMFPLGDRHLTPEEKQFTGNAVPNGEAVLRKGANQESLHKAGPEALEEKSRLPRILIVEDHKELREYLKEHLSEEYHVMDAPNGSRALEQIMQFRPDLIIADWIMPVMDGEALVRKLREDPRLSTIPVILLTGKSEMHEQQAGLELGADLVITKPFNIQLLISQIHRTIENNRMRIRSYGTFSTENIKDTKHIHDALFLEQLDKAILKYIRDVSLNAATLAGELGISRTVLYGKLKSLTGITIGAYIQRIRLKQAIRLILTENRPLSEVYIMVGFSSSSYLIRTFRKYYHTTPGEYIRAFLKTSSN